MEFLVTMTTHVPDGVSEAAVQDVRAREAAHSNELAAEGHLLRLWRPPLEPGEWRTLGLFAADDAEQLEGVLASMPLRVWRTDEVRALAPHPNDPAQQPSAARRPTGASEFFTTFELNVPPGTPDATVQEAIAREADRAAELATAGELRRLWGLPGKGLNLGLWLETNAAQLDRAVRSLPMYPLLKIATTPLREHPSDPGLHPV